MVSWTYFVAEGQPLIKTKVPKGHAQKAAGSWKKLKQLFLIPELSRGHSSAINPQVREKSR